MNTEKEGRVSLRCLRGSTKKMEKLYLDEYATEWEHSGSKNNEKRRSIPL